MKLIVIFLLSVQIAHILISRFLPVSHFCLEDSDLTAVLYVAVLISFELGFRPMFYAASIVAFSFLRSQHGKKSTKSSVRVYFTLGLDMRNFSCKRDSQ